MVSRRNLVLVTSSLFLALAAGACDSKQPSADEAPCEADEALPVAPAAPAAASGVAAAAQPAGNAAVAAAAVTPAAAPAAAGAVAIDGTSYGKGVSQPESVDIKVLLADVDKYVGKEVRVEGLVTGVCPKRGCWFDMAGDEPGEAVRFKVQDGVMVFPMEDKGKYAVAQGVVRKMEMSLEQSKKYATYQRDSYGADMDPDKVTEPMTIVRLDGTGAVIRDKQ